MYKPNFCCDCGTKIERSRYSFLTSRRFCETCAPRFRKTQILLPTVAGAALFITGLALGRAARPSAPPLLVERGELPLVSAPASKVKDHSAAAEPQKTSASKPEPTYGPDGTASERPTDPEEVVAICGARTQKGTPCQRRVRGTGRCWQHRGLPAMIPLEKRIVKSKDEG